ncbi:MAG: hypothetical protein ABII89_06615 [Candidatus Omnitrophota bacterium]
MEVEVGNNASSDEIRGKFKEMYQILEVSVKEQIVSNGAPVPEERKDTSAEDPITPNQKKLIEKLVKEQGIFGKERIRILGVKTKEEAKTIIKNLLSNGPGRQGEE